jgi:hypothetical protein
MIEHIMRALTEKKYKELSECFSKDAVYIDYCPALEGNDCCYVYGREAIEMYFRNRFVHGHFEVASVQIESAQKATYFGFYDAPFIYAAAEIEKADENGLVVRFVARPA